jgi:hypothetical protein
VRTRSGMEPTSIALAAAPAVDDIVHVYATQLSDPGKFDPKVSRREFALAASDVATSWCFRVYSAKWHLKRHA